MLLRLLLLLRVGVCHCLLLEKLGLHMRGQRVERRHPGGCARGRKSHLLLLLLWCQRKHSRREGLMRAADKIWVRAERVMRHPCSCLLLLLLLLA